MSEVTLECTINSHSLEITRSEIKKSLRDSSAAFEIFLSDANDEEALSRCADNLRQLNGVLNVIDLRGPEIIARDLYTVASSLVNESGEQAQNHLAALGTGILALERFVDFIQVRQKDVPVLAVDSANTIRKSCGMPLLFESGCSGATAEKRFTRDSKLSFSGETLAPEQLSELVNGLLVHFQRALAAVINGDFAGIHFHSMSRVLRQVCVATSPGPWQRFWFMAFVTLKCFERRGLVLLEGRKVALAQLEGLLRALSSDQGFIAQPVPEALEAEFAYLLGVNSYRQGPVAEFINLANIDTLNPDDSQLNLWLEELSGPSAGTVKSVLAEVRSELGQAVDLLEVVAKREDGAVEELAKLSDLVDRCVSVLRVVNLEVVATSLADQSNKLSAINTSSTATEIGDTCMQAADVFLRVDSYLERFTDENSGRKGGAPAESVFVEELENKVNPFIGEAKSLAMGELQVGIAKVKALIAEQVETGQLTHLPEEVTDTLQELTGVSLLLGLKRANLVISACHQFAMNVSELGQLPENKQLQRMTTFADVLVSLEYYLEDFALRNHADSNVLQIAEDSLQILGYEVQG